MLQKEKLNINITENPKDFKACAIMMAGTDPWITLGMSYDDCLKAFEGECKEIIF